jgi:hypothetical protein
MMLSAKAWNELCRLLSSVRKSTAVFFATSGRT